MNSYAAHLLAYALDHHFPDCIREGGELADVTFKYRFFNKAPIPEDFAPYLEETMRAQARSVEEIRLQEMVGSNAADLLREEGQPLLAERAEQEEVVGLVKIGNTFDLALEEFERGPVFFKILSLKPVEEGYEIEGVAFSSEEALKSFLKKWRKWEKLDLSREKLVFFDERDHLTFLPKGVLFREEVLSQIPFEEGILKARGLDQEGLAPFIEILRPKKLPLVVQNWNDKGEFTLHVHRWGELAGLCSSSLQMIHKTVNILRFEAQVTLCGLRPPNDVSERVKELWIQGVRALKNVLDNEGISYREERYGGPKGPEVKIALLDELGAAFEGPSLRIDCIASEEVRTIRYAPAEEMVVMVRSLVPDLDQLALKMMEQKLLNRSDIES